MKYGAHSQMFVDDIAEDPAGVFRLVASYGLDAVEVHVARAEDFPADAVAEAAAETGLDVVLGTALGADRSTISDDPEVRARGIAHLEGCIRIAEKVGARKIAGGIHSANGVFVGRGRTDEEWNRSIEALRTVAPKAEAAGVLLTVEPVSRYSGYFLNTAADAIALVEAVGSSSVKVQLDTYHMNIEEADPAAAIRATGGLLGHFHAVENNRGVPGTGQVPWAAVFAALADIGYDDLMVYEHFPLDLPRMAVRTHTWRHLATSREVCIDGTANLKAVANGSGE
ncbi:sugar phosphate isomerase/epimerase [Brooklawnia cerclae]|uniref:D-psicose/D-tagatose/L-ribulose 3-epimerase n=1 Tax=Brooklawnia cerclae TaxID=349934 RepID=A0ABX0SL58_9ACTN|nr:sugar phosphate isomerase/epimerase family protein [Brooklawnia cerclae]NIH58058.1 D-psicose/D-tagatose/L-ribulose 3-epimerase [Brooklawnia cerclae]